MTALQARSAIQAILGVKQDGIWGDLTADAMSHLHSLDGASPWPPPAVPPEADGTKHQCKASSFADAKDLAAFNKAKAEGKSDQEAFEVGDNCVGKWGDFTGNPDSPMCALPPEIWEAKWGEGSTARGKLVAVTYEGKTVIGEMRDTMPHLEHITNGAGIDLNPGFARAFGIEPGFMIDVTWAWVE